MEKMSNAGNVTDAPIAQFGTCGHRPFPNEATPGVSALEMFSINARKRVEAQNESAESAHYERTIQALTTQEAKARALMKAATEIARNTPAERQAATAGESQARARYQNGLVSVVEVAVS